MNDYIATAKKAVMEAGKILLANFHKQHKLSYKLTRCRAMVTAVDVASERAIRRIITRAHPSHQIIGEEGGIT